MLTTVTEGSSDLSLHPRSQVLVRVTRGGWEQTRDLQRQAPTVGSSDLSLYPRREVLILVRVPRDDRDRVRDLQRQTLTNEGRPEGHKWYRWKLGNRCGF